MGSRQLQPVTRDASPLAHLFSNQVLEARADPTEIGLDERYSGAICALSHEGLST
jgi:hypothetical protein